ncbi:hypothetical protein Salat_2384500 [Sesamum alatum]|uniref:Uncharacterized protein n=1 Tax=Sesamum alatum TaxID=300844 RepID=A0AAE1XY60_9LAMI|nr:hypothetical protein Salat_2384500 [Sesamum alatum]
MLSLARRTQRPQNCLQFIALQLRSARTDVGPGQPPPRTRRRSKFSPSAMLRKTEEKSEWWVVDGEMHEIGENVPLRERFVIPRDNIPNKRRKQLREQFMRRTRLVLKESEHEPWCKRYMELYNELRENWERLYWDEGYSKKLAQDHANYDSAEDDDEDFNPYRARQPRAEQIKDQIMGRNRGSDTWEKVSQIRDKFEYDRERRMREKDTFLKPKTTDWKVPILEIFNSLLCAEQSSTSQGSSLLVWHDTGSDTSGFTILNNLHVYNFGSELWETSFGWLWDTAHSCNRHSLTLVSYPNIELVLAPIMSSWMYNYQSHKYRNI